MKRRSLLAGATALALARPAFASTPTKVVFWHSMNGALGDELDKLIARFNASQSAYEVVGVFKGGYAEALTAAIAAWRAGQAPHIVQVFEVGTGSMIAAGPAVKPLWQLVQETGAPIKPENYIASVRGYYSLADGRMASMPFNSSTAVMWHNQDAFEKAGLDPAKPPATWPELVQAAEVLQAKKVTDYAVTTSWPTWIHFEQFAAIHNLPYATESDGFKGLNAELLVDAAPFVNNLQRLLDMAKAGSFKYAGRDNLPDPIFYSGQAAITFNSSSSRGALVKSAKFRFADADLPYDPQVIAKPINSIIGGASLWTMTAPRRAEEEYKGVAAFFAFLGQPAQDAEWASVTGYVPVTFAGSDRMRQQGYFEKNVGADLPVLQLERLPVTDNSRGIRLGNMPEIRVIIEEEWEKALGGQQDAKTALANAVSRGNAVLRSFQRSVGG
ncbi:MAG TPA: sn-glycerol-3-phosphate ABC transporter substrate-binding protein UgpB [Acetobacteraceae bacterium]|nr:sn-glycerol-3-phosphate ABC transporter substrate-binding protein UgpB [Acetobacteraceae bacterium]